MYKEQYNNVVMKPIDLVMLALGAGALVLALLECAELVPARVDQRVLMMVALLFWGRVALRLRMEDSGSNARRCCRKSRRSR